MFRGKPVVFEGKEFSLKTRNNLRQYQTRGLLFIEQNPKKTTKWAEMARNGAKIMWIISLTDNKYLYQVINGRVKQLKDFKTSSWRRKTIA